MSINAIYVNRAGSILLVHDMGANNAGTGRRLIVPGEQLNIVRAADPCSVFAHTSKGIELAFDLALERKIAEAKDDPACEVLEDLLAVQMVAV